MKRRVNEHRSTNGKVESLLTITSGGELTAEDIIVAPKQIWSLSPKTYLVFLRLRVSRSDRQRQYPMNKVVRPFSIVISGDGGILATVTKTVTEP